MIHNNNSYAQDLVSIIMPTHNSEKYVEDSIASVLNQTYTNWELHIIDDASSDNTVQLLENYKKQDSRINIYLRSINQGAAVTRNIGLEKAIGQYIAFIDSDDIWEFNKLKEQLQFMKESMTAFSFTAYKIIDENGNETGKCVDLNSKNIVGYRDMLAKKATLGCSTVMLDQSVIGKVQMPLVRTGQDYALWLKILKNGYTAHCLQQTLTKYRIVPGSISRNKFKKAKRQWEIYRKIERLNILESIYYFMNYAWRAVFRA